MNKVVLINDRPFITDTLRIETISSGDKNLRKLQSTFRVKSSEYHEVTTLLYQNDFTVTVPNESIAFQATIQNYSTSITNLYKEGAVGEFYLELIEKN